MANYIPQKSFVDFTNIDHSTNLSHLPPDQVRQILSNVQMATTNILMMPGTLSKDLAGVIGKQDVYEDEEVPVDACDDKKSKESASPLEPKKTEKQETDDGRNQKGKVKKSPVITEDTVFDALRKKTSFRERTAVSANLRTLIHQRNEKYGTWEESLEKWIQNHISKDEERQFLRGQSGHQERPEALSRQRIMQILKRAFRNFTIHGLKKDGGIRAKGDLDGEGALLLLRECGILNEKQDTVYYSEHDVNPYTDEAYQGAGVYIDVGGNNVNEVGEFISPGLDVLVTAKGRVNSFQNSRVVLDHHPEGPSSATRIVFQVLKAFNVIPKEKLGQMERFVHFVDMIDSYGYRLVGSDYDHAHETLAGLRYQLRPEFIYKYFERKNATGLEILDRKTMLMPGASYYDKEKGKRVTLKVKEISKQRREKIETSLQEFKEVKEEGNTLGLHGQTMLVDVGGKLTNAMEVVSHENIGVIRMFPDTGDIYVYSPKPLRNELAQYGILVRGHILIIKDREKQKAFLEETAGRNVLKKSLLKPDEIPEWKLRMQKIDEANRLTKKEDWKPIDKLASAPVRTGDVIVFKTKGTTPEDRLTVTLEIQSFDPLMMGNVMIRKGKESIQYMENRGLNLVPQGRRSTGLMLCDGDESTPLGSLTSFRIVSQNEPEVPLTAAGTPANGGAVPLDANFVQPALENGADTQSNTFHTGGGQFDDQSRLEIKAQQPDFNVPPEDQGDIIDSDFATISGAENEHLEGNLMAGNYPEFAVIGGSDIGYSIKQGKSNEDRVLIDSVRKLAAVIDGMGGHRFGGEAAQILAEAIQRGGSREDILYRAQAEMQSQLQGDDRAGAAFLAAQLRNEAGQKFIDTFGAGDCKLMIYDEDGNCTFETFEESQVSDLLQGGTINKNQAACHPWRNRITNAIQAKQGKISDFGTYEVKTGYRVVLVSDGVSDNFTPDEIGKLIHEKEAYDAINNIAKELQGRMENHESLINAMPNEIRSVSDVPYGDGYFLQPKPDNFSIVILDIK